MRLPYKKCYITKLFGTPPPEGMTYRYGYHTGIDLVGVDKNVMACESGKVTVSSFDKTGWGNFVEIKGESGYTTIYCHLKERKVAYGETIAEGQIIGTEGATGQTTGRHLHLEFRKNPVDGKTAIDPCIMLNLKIQLGEAIRDLRTAEEALAYLVEIGFIEDAEYWTKVIDTTKYFDSFILKVANRLVAGK